MGSLANFAEAKILNHLVGKESWTMPTVYVALSTTEPQEDGTGVSEPSDGYARKATTGADWETATAGAIQNANDITFNEASGPWGSITHFALYNASSAGNMLASSILGAAKTISNGDTPKFAAGDLDITLD